MGVVPTEDTHNATIYVSLKYKLCNHVLYNSHHLDDTSSAVNVPECAGAGHGG